MVPAIAGTVPAIAGTVLAMASTISGGGGLPPGRNGAAYWRHDIWPDGGNEPPAAIAAGGRCVPPPGIPGGGGWGGMNDEAPWEPREWRAFPAGLRAGRCGAGYGRHGMVLAKASTVCRKGLRAGGAKKAGRAGALGERGPGGKAGLEGTRTWKAGGGALKRAGKNGWLEGGN